MSERIPLKEDPAVASDAGTHEVPCTVEAGVFEHLDKVNREFAEKAYNEEAARIDAAFDRSHDRLESAAEIAHGVTKEHSGFESDPLTPRVPRFEDGDSHGRYRSDNGRD